MSDRIFFRDTRTGATISCSTQEDADELRTAYAEAGNGMCLEAAAAPTPRTPEALPENTPEYFRELVSAIRDCADRILRGDDSGHVWTTTLHSHAFVIANDFDCFGQPIPAVTEAGDGSTRIG